MATFTWNCSTVDAYPTYEAMTDVVYNVHWNLSGSEEVEGVVYSSSVYGTQSLSVEDIETFVPFADLTNETVRIPVDSHAGGRTLQELDLIRRFGVQLCGIQRGRERRILPDGQTTLEPGDRLLVVGTHDRINEFRGWIESTAAAADPG